MWTLLLINCHNSKKIMRCNMHISVKNSINVFERRPATTNYWWTASKYVLRIEDHKWSKSFSLNCSSWNFSEVKINFNKVILKNLVVVYQLSEINPYRRIFVSILNHNPPNAMTIKWSHTISYLLLFYYTSISSLLKLRPGQHWAATGKCAVPKHCITHPANSGQDNTERQQAGVLFPSIA